MTTASSAHGSELPRAARTDAWRPVHRSRAYELVVERIEEQITSGALHVGDTLPAERDLAERLQVSRAAVREAIRTLEAQGAVRSAVGSRPVAGTQVVAETSDALTRLLRLHVALSSFPMADVLEARVMLERSSASLAAGNASAQDLSGLREILRDMDEPGIDRAQFNELDTAFHVALAEAGHNRLVTDMTIAIRESMRLPILQAFGTLEDSDALIARLRAEHHGILDAIEEGSAQLASERIEAHIRAAYASLWG
ncbi:FadR/GntR family transcriptional regulator [Brachybacterium kimchii]|uniref:FCD domain-containing protein n=1 Tax=Brachybacterium kimchii TaxID=2942909 RepID=A0ABY4N2W5_9MICO|nr:FCD domain-containing protein [Brachybacterium kimchii]UQN28905.1 FCD domain-containing protein [Brachybacterium kimchii]